MSERPPARTETGHGSDGILLARHGETDDNREPIRVQGFLDTPLNDTGRRQAGQLAERIAGEGVASLWASDLRRASETAQIVGANIGLEPRLDWRLREGNRVCSEVVRPECLPLGVVAGPLAIVRRQLEHA